MLRNECVSRYLEENLVDWNEFYPRPYDYIVPKFVGVTGNANNPQVQQNLLIQQDWPFVITSISAQVWNAAFLNFSGASAPLYDPTGTIPEMAVQIFDNGASNFLSSDFMPLRILGGSAGRDPYELCVPYVLEKNTSVQFNLTSLDTRTFDVTIVLHGFKIVKRTQPLKPKHLKLIDDFHKLSGSQKNAVAQHVANQMPGSAASVPSVQQMIRR